MVSSNMRLFGNCRNLTFLIIIIKKKSIHIYYEHIYDINLKYTFMFLINIKLS